MVRSIGTYLTIRNNLRWNITNSWCFDVDNFDFDGSKGNPKNALRKLFILGYDEQKIRLENRVGATCCPFTLRLYFEDKSVDTFKICQNFAINMWEKPVFHDKPKNFQHELTCNREGGKTLVIDVNPTSQQSIYEGYMNIAELCLSLRKTELAVNLFNKAIGESTSELAKKEAEKGKEKASKAHAESLIKEAKLSKSKGTLNNSLNYLQDALHYSDYTHSHDLYIRIKNLLKEVYDEMGEKLQKKGNFNVKKEKFTDAISNFKEALNLDISYKVRKSIEEDYRNAKNKYTEKKAADLQNEGLSLMRQNKYKDALVKYNTALNLQSSEGLLKKSTKKSIRDKIKTANAKIRNQQGEVLLNRGKELLKKKQYKEASEIFIEALCWANETNTINSIQAVQDKMVSDNKKAQNLVKEGVALINSNDYEAAIAKFDEAMTFANKPGIVKSINEHREIAMDKIENRKAEELIKAGQELGEKQQWYEAIDQFLSAQQHVKDDKTDEKIKDELSKAHKNVAAKIYTEGLSIDVKEDQTKEEYEMAKNNLQKAKDNIQLALEFKSSKDLRKSFEIVSLKMEGNNHFNDAVVEEKKVYDLFDKVKNADFNGDDYRKIIRLIDDATYEYTTAKDDYKKCLKLMKNENISKSKKVCSDQITDLNKIRGDVIKIMVDHNIRDFKKENKEPSDNVTENS